MKHTPTPWEFDKYGNIVVGRDRLLVNGVALPMGNHPNQAEAEANAAHIVHCVNSHDALLAALKGLLEFEGIGTLEGTRDVLIFRLGTLAAKYKAAHAAIAAAEPKAEGKG